MKLILMFAACLVAFSSMTPIANAKPGDQLRICFPDRNLPDERPEGCILTPHPLDGSNHAGGPKDTMPLNFHWEKVPVHHVTPHEPPPECKKDCGGSGDDDDDDDDDNDGHNDNGHHGHHGHQGHHGHNGHDGHDGHDDNEDSDE